MPELKHGGYHAVSCIQGLEEYDVFIGRLIDDKYHLLGFRPAEMRSLFSERECSSGDLGLVILPEGRQKMNDLKPGDILHIYKDQKPGKLDGVVYKERLL